MKNWILFFSFVLPQFSSIQAATLNERLHSQRLWIGAHRGGLFAGKVFWGGYSNVEDQNTIHRYREAIRQGADFVTADLWRTSDGGVVDFHDDRLENKTNCRGLIKDHSKVEVTRCHYLGTHKRIPSLEEVFDWNGNRLIHLQIKDRGAIAHTLSEVQSHEAYDHLYLEIGSNREWYEEIRKADRKIGLLYTPNHEQDLDWILNLQDENLVILGLRDQMMTQENIEKIHRAGKLAAENSFTFDPFWRERFQAACSQTFGMGFDMAITNQVESCVKQRRHL